jgi:Protein of unknown function (DUF3137)
MLFLSVGYGVLFIWILTFGIPTLIYFMLLLAVLLVSMLFWLVKRFKAKFKPAVLPVILEFVHPDSIYLPNEFIPLDTFNRSGLFGADPAVYYGEDYIKGYIGTINFELCELDVRHPSPVKNSVETIFEGIFMHATFTEYFEGKIIVIPKESWQFQTRVIKGITKEGGRKVTGLGEDFDEIFLAYSWADFNPRNILSEEMVASMVDFVHTKRKLLYLSFVNGHIYIAIHEDYDLLEPRIFLANDNFETMVEYWEDLRMLTSLVMEFDLKH